ncbi:MAG: LysR family transcriptional regulator [Magnetococcales bacterium]|nr:LysR family transcriptional regulator [Magnetococcales bacterium]
MDRLAFMETFVRVVESGSFAEAARKGGLSRAAVSKYIEALEEHLGARLINRTTRRLHLTVEGEVYYQRCSRILDEILEAEQTITHLHSEPRGLLRVSAPMSFGSLHLAPLVAEFLLAHPAVEVDLVLNDRFVDLVEEGFDVAVRIGTLGDSTLVARRLAAARLLLCAAPAYLDQRGEPMTPEDLNNHTCLLYSYTASPGVWRFRRDGEEQSVRVTGVLRANNGEALRTAARAGLGLVMLPSFLVAEDLRSGRLKPVLNDYTLLPTLGIHAVCPSNRHLAAKVRRFIDFLVTRFANAAEW